MLQSTDMQRASGVYTQHDTGNPRTVTPENRNGKHAHLTIDPQRLNMYEDNNKCTCILHAFHDNSKQKLS